MLINSACKGDIAKNFNSSVRQMQLAAGRNLETTMLAPLQVMHTYNALFRHLLRLKRVSMELETAWAALGRQLARHAGAQHAQQLLCQARHNMTHFISNLQIYMQVHIPWLPFSSRCLGPGRFPLPA